MKIDEVNLVALLRQRRLDLGLTQPQLAQRAGLSLPAIQQIESGRGNPGLRTLLSLFSVLGIDAEVQVRTPNWGALAAFGVPLLVESDVRGASALSALEGAELLREAAAVTDWDERQREALQATLSAIQSHYPSFFARELADHSGVMKLIGLPVTGRVIKLRRLALAKVCEVL